MLARLDMQMALVANELQKRTPPSASESMFGVLRTRLQAHERESAR
jgi:hypothetical protein